MKGGGEKKRRGTSIVSKCPLALSGTVRFIHVEKRRALFGLATRTGDEKPRGGIVCIAATFLLLPRLTLSLLLLFFLSLFLSSSPSRDLVLARDSYRRFCRSSFQELLCCPDVITGYLSFALRSRERRNGAGPLLGFPRMESFSLWFIISSGWSIMRNVIVLILLSVFENLVFFWSSSVCDLITIVLHRLKLLPFARS